MGDTFRRFSDDYSDGKKIKKVKKNKRIIDKYRKAVYNYDSNDNAFDEYLDYEYKQNKSKIR